MRRAPALPELDLTPLRAAATQAPAAPGVYTFHGEHDTLPLYIGKSVDLRARLLAHLRNPDEARMLAQTRRISYQRTAGDIGAQLLEARLIKQQQPLFNRRLRRQRQLCSLRLHDGRPDVVDARNVDFARDPALFGLYASRHAARAALIELADAQRLCWGLLGIERVAPGRPCFRAQLGRCAGACCGNEGADAHQQRLHAALQRLRLHVWPFAGAVGLLERDGGGMQQIHVVRDWCHLGSVDTAEQARALRTVAAGFDADGYRILLAPVLEGRLELLELG